MMEQENKVVFRNALNGYNKADVNEYITTLAKEFARRKEDFEAESAKLQDELNDERSEKEALLEKFKKLTAEHEILTVSKKKTEGDLAKASDLNKNNEQKHADLQAELTKLQAELEEANRALAAQRELVTKQKKNAESLASELTTLKNKFSDKNAELDSLKKALSDAEQVHMERYASLTKQAALSEKYEQEVKDLKQELFAKEEQLASVRMDLLVACESKDDSEETQVILTEIRSGVDQMMASFDGKIASLDDKLTNLSALPVQKEEKKEEAPKKEASALNKKIDAFFEA